MVEQTWAAQLLADAYKTACKNNPLETDDLRSRELLAQSDTKIIDHTLSDWQSFFDANEFSETVYSEDPTYYYKWQEWRGKKIESYSDLDPMQCNELFWEGWDMLEYYRQQDQDRFVELLPELAEELANEHGITVLCPITNGTLDLPEQEIVWGNLLILSDDDWDKCYEILSEYTDLIWREVGYFDTASVVSVFEAIDEDLEWWNGQDGVLARIDHLVSDSRFRLQTHMAIAEIAVIVDQAQERWAGRVVDLVEQLEQQYENFCEETTEMVE
jgi:hypothetical protein